MMGRKSTLAYANMGVGIGLGIVATWLMGHYLEELPIGQLTAAMGFLGILFFVTDLGMGQAHIKRVSEGRDPGDCFATFAVFKLVSTLLFVAVALGGMWVYAGLLGKPFETTTLPILLVVLVYYVAKSLQEVGQSSFDARLETARSQLTSFLDTLVRTVLTIIAALGFAALVQRTGPLVGRVAPEGWAGWVVENPGLALAVATAAGGVAAAVAALVMLFRALERGRFRWELLKDYASFALPLFLASAVGIIAQNVDAFTLGLFLDTHETGVFGGIRRIVAVLGGFALPVSTLLFPAMSAAAARADRESIQRTMDRSIRYLSMLIVPMCAFTAVFAEPIIRMFIGDAFVEGAPALAVFCLYTIVITVAMPHMNLVLALGRSDVAARVGLSTAIVIIVGNLVLVPNDIQSLGIRLAGLGVLGTSIATLASGLVFYGGARYATWKLDGYRERGHLWRHLLSAGVMVGVLLALHATALPMTRWYAVAAFVPLGALVYGLGLLLLRELRREDWDYFWESVHPGEMLRYTRGELGRKRR